MISSEHTRDLLISGSKSKIILLVIDGLGGLPDSTTGKSELDTASLPNLDRLVRGSSCGMLSPLGPGFTPGSGPAHLALFGYDPWRWKIGRGALSALGTGMDFRVGDIAARLNFCTVDKSGLVTDRRAGRISTDESQALCEILSEVKIPDVEFSLKAEMDYRVAVVFRGEELSENVTESDPQKTGVAPIKVSANEPGGEKMMRAVNSFLKQTKKLLSGQPRANMVLIRGFATFPTLPSFSHIYGLNALAIATYPMYRGVAKAAGMSTVVSDNNLSSACLLMKQYWDEFDFFFVHNKGTDSAGEDGNFDKKVRLLEEIDNQIPQIIEQEPSVLVVTGDHSTPSIMRSHSWHSVPVALASSFAQPHVGASFSENGCRDGSIGTISSSSLMALVLAHSGRLGKYGA